MYYLRMMVTVILSLYAGAITPKPKEKLVWSDEFNVKGQPDASKWNYEKGYIRNKEMQYYTSGRSENARVENGNLVIEARLDSMQQDGKVVPVTSASLTTEELADWKYGRIEVRAKIPSARGTWPAIWMLGRNRKELGWPRAGEIDIMENVGFDPDTIHTNIHTEAYNHVRKTNKGKKTFVARPFDDFHIYSVNWTSEKIDFLIDNKKVFTFDNEGTGNAAWPYDQPFYLILNLAIGGAWGGQKGVDMNAFPQKFYIDYVRVYQ